VTTLRSRLFFISDISGPLALPDLLGIVTPPFLPPLTGGAGPVPFPVSAEILT